MNTRVLLFIAAGLVALPALAQTSPATTTPATTPATAAPTTPTTTTPTSSTRYIPGGYTLTSFLSTQPVRTFKMFSYTLKDNTDYRAVIETDVGRMVVDLYEQDVPMTVANFVFLARNHFYDGIIFHRVIEGFMAQTGDPQGTGSGGPGYSFADEFRLKLRHTEKGTLSMANSGPNTNGSQFFITFAAAAHLDGKHTIFGKVVEGLDVLSKIARGEPPKAPSVIRSLYIVEKAR